LKDHRVHPAQVELSGEEVQGLAQPAQTVSISCKDWIWVLLWMKVFLNAKGNMSRYGAQAVHGLVELHPSYARNRTVPT
jgi:hypothetical protein